MNTTGFLIAAIPIGGGQFVMNPVDAAMVTREFIKPKVAWSMHHGDTDEF